MSITSETRRESYEALDAATVNRRITGILEGSEGMTAREVAINMFMFNLIPYPVRQAVAPRLTELAAEGVVEAVGKKLDEQTGRKVAVYRLVEQ